MKKLAIVLGVLVLSSGAMAQEKQEKKEQRTPEQIAEKKVAKLTKELQLSDKQAQVIQSRLVTDIKAAQEMKERHKKLREQMRAEKEEQREQSTAHLKEELTEEQAKKLDAMIEERKTKIDARNLKKKAIMQEHRAKMRLHEDVKK